MVEKILEDEQPLTADGFKSLLDGTISQPKLMRDKGKHTESVRQEPSVKAKDIRHPPFRSTQGLITKFLTLLLAHAKRQLKDRHMLDICEHAQLEVVLCVPPSWCTKSKQTVMEAAKDATKASEFVTTRLGSCTEMFLCTEPEAAGSWIMTAFDRATGSNLATQSSFADLGGGIDDFGAYTVWRTDTLRLDKGVVPPTSETWVSVFLDYQFRKHVEERLEHAFDYLYELEDSTREQIVEGLVFEFERRVKRKLDLSPTNSCRQNFNVPGLQPNKPMDEAIACGSGKFVVTKEHFEAMFQPCVNSIFQMMGNQIRNCWNAGKKVDKVILLGGFSDSPTIRYHIERKLRNLSKELGFPWDIQCLQQPPMIPRHYCSLRWRRDKGVRQDKWPSTSVRGELRCSFINSL